MPKGKKKCDDCMEEVATTKIQGVSLCQECVLHNSGTGQAPCNHAHWYKDYVIKCKGCNMLLDDYDKKDFVSVLSSDKKREEYVEKTTKLIEGDSSESKRLQEANKILNSRAKIIAQMCDAHQLPLSEGKKVYDWTDSIISATKLVERHETKERDAEIAGNFLIVHDDIDVEKILDLQKKILSQ